MFNLNDNLSNILQELIKIESVTGNEKPLCDILERTLRGYGGDIIRKRDSFVINYDFVNPVKEDN